MSESDDEVEAEKMRLALAAIANEIQRLHDESLNSVGSEISESEDTLNKFIKCKSALRCKKEEVKKLKQNLKTACFIAKTVTRAKENETSLLNNHLTSTRSQYLDLLQQRKNENNLIKKLTTENQNLHDKLESFVRCIELGYKELQRIREESIDNVPTLQQLKKIILCCGQYYADYCNEHDKCMRLERKNQFLNSKIRILECKSVSASESHKNREYDVKDKATSSRRSEKRKPRECITIGAVCSEYQLNKSQNKSSNLTMKKIRSIITKSRDLDLTTHLDIVKKLLNEQDSMLTELKGLSKEIIHLETS